MSGALRAADKSDYVTLWILSDSRHPFLPLVVGFVPSAGSSPDHVEVVGGGVCINAIAFSFTATSGDNTACYRFLVESDRCSGSVTLTGSQTGMEAVGDVPDPANGATIQSPGQEIYQLSLGAKLGRGADVTATCPSGQSRPARFAAKWITDRQVSG